MADAPRPDAEPMTWAALRDASSTVQLAVQMLAGPLAPWSDPPPDPERVREVVGTLMTASRRVSALVAALRVDAPLPVGALPSASVVMAPVLTEAAPNRPSRAAKERRRAPESTPTPAVAPSFAVDDLLREVEIAVLTRTGERVAVHAAPDLRGVGDAGDVLPVLVAWVMDAIAMGPASPIVEVRAFADLADVLGEEMDVVFEVRPDPRVPQGRACRPDAAALPSGVRVEVHGAGARLRACLRIAASPAARILAA